ncbi:MAG TPA: DUF523 and DUF1722 domain-containing protein [Acidimicrobiia bacterium]|nr:DUF523 and DUF1722 domain-containing protein [Acidimicrobiia bacterium]
MSASDHGSSPIIIGISSCLLGEPVRWNGGHTRQPFLVETLGRFVEYVTVCPEVEVGMGVPRPTVRLERGEDGPRMVDGKNSIDWTPAMTRLSKKRVEMVDERGLSGFILKKDSPTCGPFKVKLYDGGGSTRQATGVFAAALMERFPLLPVEDEGRLNDPGLRENFIERVFAYRRVEDLFTGPWRHGDVVAFHTREKLLLRSHDETRYRELGRLVAEGRRMPRPAFAARYAELFMQAMKGKATRRRNANVLQHVAGHFKRVEDQATRRELSELIADYRSGLVPLVVPITMIRHLVRKHDVAVLQGQTYLDPHPKELMLRNHA